MRALVAWAVATVVAQMIGSSPGVAQDSAPIPDRDDRLAAARAALERSEAARNRGGFAAARQDVAAALAELSEVQLDPFVADCLVSVYSDARDVGDLATALAAMSRVRAFSEATLPEEHDMVQAARLNEAVVLKELGNLHEARLMEERVLAIRLRALPADHENVQATRMNLADSLRGLGDLSRARQLGEAALDACLRTLPEENMILQRARAGLSLTLKAQGDLERARVLEEQILAALSKVLPDEDAGVQRARLNLSGTLYMLGDLQRAKSVCTPAIEVLAEMLPEDHPDLLAGLECYAAILHGLGEVQRARVLFERILESRLRTQSDDHPLVLAAKQNLAATVSGLGDAYASRMLFEDVLAAQSRLLPEGHPDLLAARQNFGIERIAHGEFGEALRLQRSVLDARLRLLPEDHLDVSTSRALVADCLFQLGDYASARGLLEQVVSNRSRVLPPDHPDLLLARTSLGAVLFELGENEAAVSTYQAALDSGIRSLPWQHGHLQRLRSNLAMALAHEGSPVESDRFHGLVRDFGHVVGGDVAAAFEDASWREADERLQGVHADIGVALSLAQGVGVFAPDDAAIRTVLAAAMDARAAVLTIADLTRRESEHGPYESARQELASAREDVVRASRGAGDEALRAALARRETAEQRMLALVGDRSSWTTDATWELGATTVGLFYVRYDRQWFGAGTTSATDRFGAFVLRSRGVLELVDLGPAAHIESAAHEWRKSLGLATGRGSAPSEVAYATDSAAEAGETLRRLVVDPVLAVAGDATRMVVSPDDVLHTVPLDALPHARGVLGEHVSIDMQLGAGTPSRRESGSSGYAIFLGDADYAGGQAYPGIALLRGGAWEHGFDALPFTGDEARGIAGLFDAATKGASDAILLEADAATRDAVERLAPHARILHLATHGWFAPESIRSSADREVIDEKLGILGQSLADRITGASPMVLCGLALAGANLPPDELGRTPGLITAEEIAGWDLSNCELAVLSACNTNVGIVRAGQGVASLQKALHMAGARSVITSLWKVPDEATKVLMLDFYRRMWIEKKPKRQALWEAKMALRDARNADGKPKYAMRDWAAWVLTGDPE